MTNPSYLDLSALPADARVGARSAPESSGYRRLDQALQQEHVEGIFQVAARLSYHFWDTSPDAALALLPVRERHAAVPVSVAP